jgi:hypothetical protein
MGMKGSLCFPTRVRTKTHFLLALSATVFLARCSCAQKNTECDDGIFCNGQETFIDSRCTAGTPPSCDDAMACTEDLCDTAVDACVHRPDHALCQDGSFCNGAETCDAELGCLAADSVDCDDSIACTEDFCDEEAGGCLNVPDNGPCDDGLWCNGAETCDPGVGCLAGSTAACDDGVACTVDTCDEPSRSCLNIPSGSLCDDDLFCTTNERCDPLLGCLSDELSCDDSIECTLDSCDEEADVCLHVPDHSACEAGGICSVGFCDLEAGCIQAQAPDGISCDVSDPAMICIDGACESRHCGDGYAEPLDSGFPAEECDDGDGEDLDGCTTLCRSLDFQVNTTEERAQRIPAAAVLEDGSFVIAFEDVTSTSPAHTDVRLRRFDRRGTPADDEDVIMSSTSTGMQLAPSMVALPGGGFAATWADNSAHGAEQYEIKLRNFNASGVPLTEVAASGSALRYRTEPRLEYLPTSDLILVMWEDFTTIEGQLMMRRFDADGLAVDADEWEVPTDPLIHRSQPAASETPDGGFVLVWTGSDDGVTTKVFSRLFDVTSLPVSDMVEIPSASCGLNYAASVALVGDPGEQKFVVVWERVCSGSSDSQIAATLLDPAALEPVSEPVTVSSASIEGFSPVLLAGRLLAKTPGSMDPPTERWVAAFVWAGQNDPLRDTDGPYDIYGRRYILEAGSLVVFDPEPLLMTTTLRFEQSEPAGAINAAGNLVLAWTDRSNTGTDRSSSSVRGRYLPNGWLLLE